MAKFRKVDVSQPRTLAFETNSRQEIMTAGISKELPGLVLHEVWETIESS